MFDQEFFRGLRGRIRNLNKQYAETFEEPILKDWYQVVVYTKSTAGRIQYFMADPSDNQFLSVAAFDPETESSRIVFIPYDDIARVETGTTRRVGGETDQKPRRFGFHIDEQ